MATAPSVPNFSQYNFELGDTTQVVTKQNGLNAALEAFGNGLGAMTSSINQDLSTMAGLKGDTEDAAQAAAGAASAASTSESNAQGYANAASGSASAAAGSATTASNAANAASTSETNAGNSANAAAGSASAASDSASAAAGSASAAQTAESGAESALVDFLTRYLGPKSSAPSTDNDGQPLQVGALYLSTASGDEGMRYWDGSQWRNAYATIDGVSWAEVAGKPTFAAVATSGAYADLSGTPGNATTSVAGLMAAADKSKLNGVEAGAQVNPIIVDGLTSTASGQPLSANQGRVLKGLIDSINTLLSSDDTTLDELQEIVNYIKLNRSELDNLSIASIAGLQSALDAKRAQTDTSFPRYDLASASTTATLDLAAQQVFRVDASSNRTLSFSNAPGSNRAMTVVIRITGSTGTITWPAGIEWAEGTAPELRDAWTAVTLLWDGATWRGFVSGGAD